MNIDNHKILVKNALSICSRLAHFNSISAEEIETNLEELNHLCDYEQVCIKISQNKYHLKILDILKHKDPKIKILNILLKIIKYPTGNDKSFLLLVTLSICEILIQVDNYRIHESCLNFLVDIFKDEFNEIWSIDDKNKLRDSIIKSIKWNNQNIVFNSLHLLYNLNDSENVINRFLLKDIDEFIKELRNLSGTSYVKMGNIICKLFLKALESIDNEDFESISKSNIDEILIKILFKSHTIISEDYYLIVMKLFCKILFFTFKKEASISTISKDNCAYIIIHKHQSDIVSFLLDSLKRYNTKDIIIYGFQIFFLLVSLSKSLKKILNESNQESWILFILDVLKNNIICSETIEWSFRIINRIIILNPKIIHLTENNEYLHDTSLDSLLIQIFYSSTELSPLAFYSCCELISNLSKNSEKMQNHFLETQIHTIIHMMVVKYFQTKSLDKHIEYKIRLASTNVMRFLIRYNLSAKELFFNEQTQYENAKGFLISSCKHDHGDYEYEEAFSSIILFLASLVEYNSLKYDFMQSLQLILMNWLSCERCSMSPTIIEAFQELLIVLSGLENEIIFLTEIFSISDCCEIASKFLNIYAIQKNSMIFLQLNSSKIHNVERSKIFDAIGEVIFRATSLFKNCLVLCAEACVLIQILIKQYPDFTKICVENDLDKFLFETINMNQNPELVKISLQAFYVLTESQEIRESILIKAIKQCNLMLFQCMIAIGCNLAKVSQDLLLAAIKVKDESSSYKLMSHLLNNGCKPETYVISRCFDANNYNNVILLMRLYGINDSNEGKIINWSDLGMKRFQISWLTNLCEKSKDTINSNIIWLSKRIKQESKNRMLLRKNYEKNQNSIVKLFRYPYTQMRTLDKDIAGHQYYTRLSNLSIKISSTVTDKPYSICSLKDNSNELNIHNLRNYSLKTISATENLKMNLSEKDTKSEEFLYSNKTLIKQKPSKLGYQPVKGELSEFLTAFRCGSDFAYHPLDPRCLHEKQNTNLEEVKERESQIVCDFTDSYLDFSIKLYKESNSTTFQTQFLSESIAENYLKIDKISFLNLSKNELKNLEDFIESPIEPNLTSVFQHLTTLRLEKNSIEFISESAFRNMEKLKVLDISENKLTEFPWFLFKFSPLVTLNLCKNKLKEFRLLESDKSKIKSFGQTIFLSNLNLSKNKFSTFDIDSLDVFPELHVIELNEISIIISDNSLQSLNCLKKLSLKGNLITTINERFLENCNLIDSINLSDNKLVSVDNTMAINLASFENLTDLNLSRNNLACGKPFFIPKCILKIPKLQIIDMSYNEIVAFPPCTMWASKCLNEINFSHNQIQDLNLLNAKTSFQNLNILDLSYNCLRRISPEIGHLSNLTLLDISHNPSLKKLPDEIGLLKGKSLNSLIKDGLNLNIPKHFDNKAQLREILKYYYDRLKHSVEYNGLRLMVLGFKGRGKTSVLNLLQGKKTKSITNTNSTEIDVSIWKVQAKMHDRTSEYKLTCWDISGQDELFCSHDCFLSPRAFYLLVFDITKEIEEIHKLKPVLWNLKCQAPHAPLIIVGTHLDKIKENELISQCSFIKSSLTKLCSTPGFPKILDIVFVNAKYSNLTITNLKKKILTVLQNHSFQNDQLLFEKQPSSYVKLEDLFQETLKTLPPNCPILTEKEVKDLVIKHKLDLNDEELRLAVQFLHNCGVIVHFNDTVENLNNLYFLKPQWIYSIILKTITMTCLNPLVPMEKFLDFIQKKFISHDSENFPLKNLAKQCFKVLELYDMVFQNSINEIIIPSKLPNQQPTNLADILNRMTSKITRIFEFSFLPTGFWPRLIARIYVLGNSFERRFDVCELVLNMWRTGVIITLEKSIYLVLEAKKHNEKNLEIIEISVSKSELGIKILVQVVDCIEVLIEEWYAGLNDDDLRGNRVMTCFVRCLECSEQIPLLEIARISLQSDYMICKLNHQIPFRIVVPDIVLGDLSDEIIINPSDLEVNQTKENIIGIGGNGSVFRGFYKGKDCAVKYLNTPDYSNDPPSYRLLRQEIDILRRFQHPSIVSMLAVDRKRIVLEFAPFKDLKYILSHYINLSLVLLQRIAFQIINGIQYLHLNNIIYRDIKMQNVLVFSLELSSLINVKISDYGISREVAPFGFIIPQGTPGYQAPEVLERSISYKFPADIFSFGILMFNIGTMGRHPSESKAHWRAGKQVELISEYNDICWPRMQDCINKCTKLVPEDRPCAEDISNFIMCSTFVAIKSVWSLTRQTRIECMTTMMNENNSLNVFLANGNKFKQEIRSLDVNSGQSKGKSFSKEENSNRILSMFVLENIIFLGTQNGQLWTYDHFKNKLKKTSIVLPDSILSILLRKIVKDSKMLMVGLVDGTIFYKLNYVLHQSVSSDNFIKLQLSDAPVINICTIDDHIFATSGFMIFKLNFSINDERFTPIKLIEIDSIDQDRLIKCFCPFTENINGDLSTSFYFTIRNECLIHNFDDQGNQLKPAIDCKELIREKLRITNKSYYCRIMCMTIWSGERYLCAGTGNGYLIIIDQEINYTLVLSIFNNPIICIQHSKLSNKHDKDDKEMNKSKTTAKSEVIDHLLNTEETSRYSDEHTGLIIVGNGYKSIGEDFNGAALIVLSDDISNIARQLNEHINARNNIL